MAALPGSLYPSRAMQMSTAPPLLAMMLMALQALLILRCSPLLVAAADNDGKTASDCPLEPSAWALLRFNLPAQSAAAAAGSSSSRPQIRVERASLARLEALSTRLAVVSIIGPYRTGKSTLLNRLLPSRIPPAVFSVGHTVVPHTEDVSLYVVPPCALTAEEASLVPGNTSLVFVDTPGLFAPDRNALFDAQLLAVLNLVSSLLVYNGVGVIKRGEVEQLSDAVDAAFALSYYGDDNSSRAIDRPHLIWVMQNLQVELRDRDGKELSSRSYIQSVLSDIDHSANVSSSSGSGAAASSSSLSVSSRFNKFFSSLDSFALPFPTSDFKDAKRLSAMSESEFTAEYREEKARLKSRVSALLQPKRLGNNVLGGAMLAQLLSSWTDNVNVEQPAARQSSASALMRSINEKEVAKAVTRYKAEMRPVTLPLPDAELRRLHDAAVRAAVSGLRLQDLPDFSSLFEQEANALYAQYLRLSEEQLRGQLEARAKLSLQDWRERVVELRKRLPLEPAALLQAEEAAKARWRDGVAALRSIGPALSTDFDRQVSGSLETERRQLLLDSLVAFKHRHKQQAETAVAALPLPSEEELAARVESEQLIAWTVLASTFSSLLSAAELEPHAAEMRGFLSSRLSEWKARNAEESTRLCGLEAVRLSRQLMRDSEERWTDSPHFASLSALRAHMQQLQQSPLCVGPGRSHEAVAYQLSKAQRAIAEQIQQRTTVTQLAYGAAALVALRLLLVCRRLAAGGGDGSRGYELLGAAEGKDARREAAGCAAISRADQLLLLAALPLAALLHWSGSHVPDASAGYWQLALWSAVIALAAAALLSCTLTASRAMGCCRGGKSSHEH